METKNTKQNQRNIGLDVPMPKETCNDPNCPFHGTLNVKKKTFDGIVTADKMQKTVSVELERRIHIPKYERYEKRKSRLKAHNPPCINAKIGDIVRIAQTRPLSKTKNFVVVQILKKKD